MLGERSITQMKKARRTARNQAAKISGIQFLWKASLQSYHSSIFADVCDHAHYALYNRAYFVHLIFGDSNFSAKISRYTVS